MAWAPGRLDRSRSAKLAVISFCLALSYFTLRAATTGDRVQRDEVIVDTDIIHLLQTGHLPEPATYSVGNGYAILSGMVLSIMDLGYPALELLSPALGALAVGVFTLIALGFVRQLRSPAGPWVALGFPASLLVFGGFTLRIAETTHKKFTFVLVYLTLLAAFRHFDPSPTDGRWRGLFVGVASAVALFNHVWAVIYGMAAILAQFPSRITRRRAIIGGAIPLVVAYVLPVHLPTAGLNVQYARLFVTGILGGEITTIRVMDVGGIPGWPPISVAGLSFSSWFVYASGMFAVAAIAGVAGLHALASLRDDPSPFARFYVVVGAWFAVLVAVMLVANDLATFRRVIVIPGSIGVLYALHALSTTGHLSERRRRLAMTAVVAVLLLGSVLAIPRAVLDGDPAPYDYYAEDNEVAKFEWWLTHAPAESCLQTHQFVDLTASQLVWGAEREGRAVAVPYDPSANVVYASGSEAFLSCSTG